MQAQAHPLRRDFPSMVRRLDHDSSDEITDRQVVETAQSTRYDVTTWRTWDQIRRVRVEAQSKYHLYSHPQQRADWIYGSRLASFHIQI